MVPRPPGIRPKEQQQFYGIRTEQLLCWFPSAVVEPLDMSKSVWCGQKQGLRLLSSQMRTHYMGDVSNRKGICVGLRSISYKKFTFL